MKKKNPAFLDDVLEQRHERYGTFNDNALLSQKLKSVVGYHYTSTCPFPWANLSPDKKEAIEMIFHKISRIVNGDPEYKDSWVDIAGYATLVAESLSDEKKD